MRGADTRELDCARLDALRLAVDTIGDRGVHAAHVTGECAQRRERRPALEHAAPGKEVLRDHRAELGETGTLDQPGCERGGCRRGTRSDLLHREPNAEHAEAIDELAPELDREVARVHVRQLVG